MACYNVRVCTNASEHVIMFVVLFQILGLDTCADTLVGDAMRRGISGVQKKRLTTAEMIVAPAKALFMDEITNGLDSSAAFQIVACLQHPAHITDATLLVSLLQPAPETFDLFDDLILMSEGKVVYHGPRDHVLKFFDDCGFKCPERKAVADCIQEVSLKRINHTIGIAPNLTTMHPSICFQKNSRHLLLGGS
ncbi:pleiotropic drug resistance protein 3-like [Malus sylvestris]|uniref:pleiotropic drug resistance protein 3-like n=1 Tax=Malus sylvestris TaxID=3752 RepID=UPI0021AC592F|nr:pleiotropic drug resistance protein 3-like [Malus sylvestris]